MRKLEWSTYPVSDFCETLIWISKLRVSRKTIISFLILTLNFFVETLILNSNPQILKELRNLYGNSLDFRVNFATFITILLLIVMIAILIVIQNCNLALYQTFFLENSILSFSFWISFFPLNSHSWLSIFPPELSFSLSTSKISMRSLILDLDSQQTYSRRSLYISRS